MSTIEIPVSGSDRPALVDDFNAWVMQHSWCMTSTGYAHSRIAGRLIYMHRLIVGDPDGIQVDHEDHDGLNNTVENLRMATNQENKWNQGKRQTYAKKPTYSAFKGVTYVKAGQRKRRWLAQIKTPDGRHLSLGHHLTEEDAARAYDDAAVKYFGSFACTNKSMNLL